MKNPQHFTKGETITFILGNVPHMYEYEGLIVEVIFNKKSPSFRKRLSPVGDLNSYRIKVLSEIMLEHEHLIGDLDTVVLVASDIYKKFIPCSEAGKVWIKELMEDNNEL